MKKNETVNGKKQINKVKKEHISFRPQMHKTTQWGTWKTCCFQSVRFFCYALYVLAASIQNPVTLTVLLFWCHSLNKDAGNLCLFITVVATLSGMLNHKWTKGPGQYKFSRSLFRVFQNETNFLNAFLHPHLTNDLLTHVRTNLLLLCVCCCPHTGALKPYLWPGAAFAAGHRGQTITIQCQGLSHCQENTYWTRKVLLCCCYLLTRRDVWSISHFGMWYMDHSFPQKICSFIHLYANYCSLSI